MVQWFNVFLEDNTVDRFITFEVGKLDWGLCFFGREKKGPQQEDV